MSTLFPRNVMKYLTLTLLAALVVGCAKQQPQYETMGSVERLDPRLDKLIPKDAQIEKLAEGFEWSEGPVYIKEGNYLLFSDVPKNVIYKWDDVQGNTEVTEHIKPSGYTGKEPRKGEMGSNGLTLDNDGRLTICQHGDRRVVRVADDGKFETLARQFEGRRFNSPNDAVWDNEGNLFFTDPFYGLEGGISDPAREIPYQGVYRRAKNGQVTVIIKDMSRPNGIALSPDHKTLYVNNSDSNKAVCMAYDIKWDGTLSKPRVFFDVTPLVKKGGLKGLPDGLKVDQKGNVFATGPGGVLVFDKDGTHLGTINTGEATANCAFGGKDGSTLYITADNYLCRIKTKTKGAK